MKLDAIIVNTAPLGDYHLNISCFIKDIGKKKFIFFGGQSRKHQGIFLPGKILKLEIDEKNNSIKNYEQTYKINLFGYF